MKGEYVGDARSRVISPHIPTPMPRSIRLAALAALLLPLAAQAQSPSADAALAHARAVASAQGFAAADFAVTDAAPVAGGRAEVVYLRQSVAGLDVVGTEASVAVTARGRVVSAPGLDRVVASAGLAAPAPALSAADAASALARHNRLPGGAFGVVERAAGVDRRTLLSDGGVAAGPVPARLVWRRDEAGAVALAWEVTLEEASGEHAWLGYVDARTGAVLAQTDLVVHDTFGHGPFLAAERAPVSPLLDGAWRTPAPAPASATAGSSMVPTYRVYPVPVEAPIYASTTPPADGRTVVSNPANTTASPQGWHSTGSTSYTTTRGNNVHAYTDVDANNSPDSGSSPSGGSGLTFDFPINLNQAPSAYRPASVTNLFYWNNVIHDVLYQYGFDEASGNFQVNNFGRGGSGNDDVRAEGQDGSGTNNANFYTPSDGSRPRMQMYIGTYSNPDVDGSFDNGVVVHEYGHGVSNRLTGGRTQAGCLGNGEQMGEGWSDWYAMMFTQRPGDSRTQARGMGNYLFDYGVNGGGIRLAPYSTSFSVNGYTYGDTRSMSAVHQIGFVWATILWEVTWDMIDAHGFSADLYNAGGSAGNQMMLQLVTEGMKLQPCSPGFVTGRDGILAADQALYGGAHLATLRAAFARRGLGYSASQGSSSRTSDNVEAFDLWPTAGNQPPTAAFTVSCSGLACQFSDGSSDPDGTIASRSWSFGDGSGSSATNPSHTYGAGGSYTASLTVTDDDGDSNTTSQTVTVTGPGGGAISLSASPRRVWWWNYTDLSWSPADGGNVTVYLNGSAIGSTADDGAVSVNMGTGASGTYAFQVCESESGGACSNVATVSFLAAPTAAARTADASGPAPTTPPDGPDVLVAPGAALAAVRTDVVVTPNPVAGSAQVRFGLPEAATVSVEVFNTLGQRVAVLADGPYGAGSHAVTFEAADLPAGVYVWRVRAGADVQTGQVAVIR